MMTKRKPRMFCHSNPGELTRFVVRHGYIAGCIMINSDIFESEADQVYDEEAVIYFPGLANCEFGVNDQNKQKYRSLPYVVRAHIEDRFTQVFALPLEKRGEWVKIERAKPPVVFNLG